MKRYINNLSFSALTLLLVMMVGPFFQSCEKEEERSSGLPKIHYVRVTDPAKSDSLLVSAFLGNTIALMGENLTNVKEIWFNDQQAYLNTSYITDFSIIVSVPTVIPEVVTNEITLVTYNDDTSTHPFGVDVPAPLLNGMLCEFVPDGSDAVIKGNYFIDDENVPLQVFFPGNLEGEVKSVSIDEVVVTVPAGAGVGPVSVKTIYGSSRSGFFFRDDRNYILDWDVLDAAGGWRSGVIDNSNPAGISGNYVRFNGEMSAEAGATWNEDAHSFNLWNASNGRPDLPFYDGDLSKAALKFECYVIDDWKSAALQMIFTPYSVSGTNGYIADGTTPRGLWSPWLETGSYVTEGWTTVTVPMSNFHFDHTGKDIGVTTTKEMLGGLTFFVWHGGVDGEECNVHMCIDNIRIVPL